MQSPHFDFKKHQNFHKNRKIILHFLIYGILLFFLVFFIYQSKKTPTEQTDDGTIKNFEVDSTALEME